MQSNQSTITAVLSDEKLYICPGETHPISRAVHLSRLAAFYPKCRDCPLRTETGQLPTQIVERFQRTERRAQRKSLFTAEGVRGVYRNELTRRHAADIAAAFAGLLWEAAPLASAGDGECPTFRRTRPTVVVGHDERPSSPDIVTGVAAALRHMGCEVIDVGLVTKPCFRFAVDHLDAIAGVYVTGAGSERSWTGLDFVDNHAVPVSQAADETETAIADVNAITLNRIEARLQEPLSRPARHAGPQTTFRASVPYEAGLWKHFHALRPLRVVCATSSRLVLETLHRLLAESPSTLFPVELPDRLRDLHDALDEDVERLSQTVRENSAHLGVLVDADACRASFVDEQGRLVPQHALSALLASALQAESPGGTVVLNSSTCTATRAGLERRGLRVIDGGDTDATFARAMLAEDADMGAAAGRYWFGESFSVCDAMRTLAEVLQLLSRSETPFSQVLAAVCDNSL